MIIKLAVQCACLWFISACAASTVPGDFSGDTSSQNSRVKNNSLSSASLEAQFLVEVNKVRSIGRRCGNKKFPAAPALTTSPKLSSAAHQHSLDMSENQFLDHVSSNGDTLVERVQEVNYAWRAVGENLAHNQKTIQQVISAWLSSPGHCSNLMSSDYTHAGVAVVNWYWTQVYASPK